MPENKHTRRDTKCDKAVLEDLRGARPIHRTAAKQLGLDLECRIALGTRWADLELHKLRLASPSLPLRPSPTKEKNVQSGM